MIKPRIRLVKNDDGHPIKSFWECVCSNGKFGYATTPKRAYEFWYYGLDEMVKRLASGL